MSLTQAELNSIVSAALTRWEATGLSAEQMAVLRSDTFDVLNLSGPYLGEAAGNHIVIDSDAAAFGWFVDNTPQDDSEFSNAVSATRLYTTPADLPAGHIDLLTTVMHEMAHTLGLNDSYATTDRDSMMYGNPTSLCGGCFDEIPNSAFLLARWSGVPGNGRQLAGVARCGCDRDQR